MATVLKRKWKTRSGEHKTAWQVNFVDQAGKRNREQFDTKREADARRIEVEGAIRDRTYRSMAGKLTVEHATDLYLARLQQRVDAGEMERASLVDVRSKLKLHVLHNEHGIAKMLLADIGPGQAEELYLNLRSGGVSSATARKVLATLRAMLSWAVEEGYLSGNRLKGHQKKRGERELKKISIPTHEDVKTLITKAKEPLSLWIRFAALTGLRASEQWALKWVHIDFGDNKIHVESRVDRYGQVGAPKSRAGNRSVPLPPSLSATLKEMRLRAGKVEYAFPNRKGKPQVHANVMQRKFRPLCKKLELCVRWHDLRHYYVSCLIEAGLSPKAIQERVGHASYQLTMDVYGHLFPSENEGEELEAIEARILEG